VQDSEARRATRTSPLHVKCREDNYSPAGLSGPANMSWGTELWVSLATLISLSLSLSLPLPLPLALAFATVAYVRPCRSSPAPRRGRSVRRAPLPPCEILRGRSENGSRRFSSVVRAPRSRIRPSKRTSVPSSCHSPPCLRRATQIRVASDGQSRLAAARVPYADRIPRHLARPVASGSRSSNVFSDVGRIPISRHDPRGQTCSRRWPPVPFILSREVPSCALVRARKQRRCSLARARVFSFLSVLFSRDVCTYVARHESRYSHERNGATRHTDSRDVRLDDFVAEFLFFSLEENYTSFSSTFAFRFRSL